MKTRTPPTADVYFDLVREFPLKPIRTLTEHEAALAVSRRLMLQPAGRKRPVGEQDYLQVLAGLIEAYERRTLPIHRGEVHERLKFIVEESGTSQATLGRIMGLKQPAVSLILAGKRGLSGEAVKRLADHFRLNARYFL